MSTGSHTMIRPGRCITRDRMYMKKDSYDVSVLMYWVIKRHHGFDVNRCFVRVLSLFCVLFCSWWFLLVCWYYINVITKCTPTKRMPYFDKQSMIQSIHNSDFLVSHVLQVLFVFILFRMIT